MAANVWDFLEHHDAPEVGHEQLIRVHTSRYLERLDQLLPAHGIAHLDPDTALSPLTLRAASRAAGAVVRAVDLVMSGAVQNAFCAVRPPGHHAESKKAMGFCFYNNIGVGIAQALCRHRLERVAVIDFDVHHGNGTEELFQDEPRVLMASIFQHPFYPYSGDAPRGQNMINIPLKAGSAGDEFRQAVLNHWLPALHDFKPQMIFISAGFDAHRDDEMGALGLVEADYAWVTEELMLVAAVHSKGRIVSSLEGGYDLPSLSRSVTAHVRALAGL